MAQMRNWPGLVTIRRLADGTYSQVYEVKKQGSASGKSYALKVISVPGTHFSGGLNMPEDKRYSFYQGIVDDIYNEISAVGEISVQKGLVTYYDCNVIEYPDTMSWEVITRMELLTPIREYLLSHVFSEEDLFRLYYEINDALKICHSAGVIHGDVGMDSIYVDEQDGSFKLGGFGLRRLVDAQCSSKEDEDALNAFFLDLRGLNAQNQEERRKRGLREEARSKPDTSAPEDPGQEMLRRQAEERRRQQILREREIARRREEAARKKAEQDDRSSGGAAAQAQARPETEADRDPFAYYERTARRPAGKTTGTTNRKTADNDPWSTSRNGSGESTDTAWNRKTSGKARTADRNPWDTASQGTGNASGSTGYGGSYPEGETAWRRSRPGDAAAGRPVKKGRKGRALLVGGTIAAITAAVIITAASNSSESYTEPSHPQYQYTQTVETDENADYNDSIPTADEAQEIIDSYIDEADHVETRKNLLGQVESESGYNDDNELIYNIYYDHGDIPESIIIYEEGGDWNMLYSAHYDDGHIRWFSEYEDDYMIRGTTYESDGSLSYCSEYDRDMDGRVLEDRYYDSDGQLDARYVYEYDGDVQTSLKVYDYKDGENTSIRAYDYDSEGNAVRQTRYNADGEVEEWTDMEYEQFKGNWEEVREYHYLADGSLDYSVELKRNSDGKIKSRIYYDSEGNETDRYSY